MRDDDCSSRTPDFLTQGRIYFQSSVNEDKTFRTTIDPLTLIKEAIYRNQLAELLLGCDAYRCLPKYTNFPGKTDIETLYDSYCVRYTDRSKAEKRSLLTNALCNIIGKYDGVMPFAWCYSLEASLQKNDPATALGLSLLPLSIMLQNSIIEFADKLVWDGSEEGSGFPHGRYDYLCRLNQNCIECQAPSFID